MPLDRHMMKRTHMFIVQLALSGNLVSITLATFTFPGCFSLVPILG